MPLRGPKNIRSPGGVGLESHTAGPGVEARERHHRTSLERLTTGLHGLVNLADLLRVQNLPEGVQREAKRVVELLVVLPEGLWNGVLAQLDDLLRPIVELHF